MDSELQPYVVYYFYNKTITEKRIKNDKYRANSAFGTSIICKSNFNRSNI